MMRPNCPIPRPPVTCGSAPPHPASRVLCGECGREGYIYTLLAFDTGYLCKQCARDTSVTPLFERPNRCQSSDPVASLQALHQAIDEPPCPEAIAAYRAICPPRPGLAVASRDLPYGRLGPVMWTAVGIAIGCSLGMVLGALSVVR